MADSKNHISRHLQSAKAWLDRAEDSFDKDSDVRGELNLLLAQAELQRVREVNRSGRWRWKYPVLKQGLAVSLAVLLAAGGFYWWDKQSVSVEPVPMAAGERIVTIEKPTALEAGRALSPATAIPLVPVTAAPAKPGQETEAAERSRTSVTVTTNRPVSTPPSQTKEVRLAPDEMQQLIRAAGKSLRGQ
ncbi:hypothetical protein EV210_11930 [Anaerospora hongkongensis]|uniref:Uncharacterized protein n=1 Tax=Anaerospora hongkongensis TaxID=244830 RepID=A0A4V2Q7S1_9FIRM|nr:hypothetical protein [Anaerospora hongkongensis]TCL32955.1 hypothetical protein EV210_11930 [Anaerospora hongkongensis]